MGPSFPKGQDLVLALVEFREVLVSFLQHVSLDGHPSLSVPTLPSNLVSSARLRNAKELET